MVQKNSMTQIKKVSVNPNTHKIYDLSELSNDQKGIDQFIKLNAGKKVIVVQGLGFVGAVMSLVCANALTEEYAVIGIDLPRENTYWKIASINEGTFPIIASDPKIEEFYQISRKKGNLYATYDTYAFSKADVIIVDINLDVQKKSSFTNDLEGYDVDLSGFKKAMESIGNNCQEDVLVLVETTVPPGTSDKIVKPILKDCLKKRGLSTSKLKLGHSYERVMPGPNYIDSIQNFYRVYAGVNEVSADATEKFLRTIISTEKYPLTRLGHTNATEMAKVLENSYRAMNIAFAVEWTRFAEEAGVNFYEVVNAIRLRPTHSNLMFPGIGVGGYCLTKDPLLASWSKQQLFGSETGLGQSEKGVMINDKMPTYAFEYFQKQYGKSLKGKKVLLMGVSYRSDVADTRYTPVEIFYRLCKQEGAEITLHDPYVTHWEELDIPVTQDLDKILDKSYDAIVISTGHFQYKKDGFESLLNTSKCFLLDTIGIWDEKSIQALNKKHEVKVLGRGDL
jgi:UDP-N-acetyl-D-glucosamine dehydrogenase